MRVIGRLTSNRVKNARPGPDGKTILLCDGGGLWLQVSAGKDGQINKSWLFRYAIAGTKTSRTGREYRHERQMGLGALHTVGLAEAREMARQARLLVLQGKDPLEEKNASRAAARGSEANRHTFADTAEAYLQKFEESWKNPKHRQQWRHSLRDHILPVLGKLEISKIDTDAVLRVLEQIWTATPETASRIRGRIETVLDFAGRSEANPARWRGHLEFRLAKRNKTRTVKHLPALPYLEIADFMRTLRAAEGIAARCLEFTILTAVRTGEAVGATWSEIDFAKRLWTIPASRTKRDREHLVPLSDACVTLLEQIAAVRHDGRIFPMNVQGMLPCLKDLRPDITVHGFRSTFRSWAGRATSHPRDVAEAALGHAIGNAVERAYMRDQLLAKRGVLMNDWAEFCARPPADVVRMDDRRLGIPA
jgi:integrase